MLSNNIIPSGSEIKNSWSMRLDRRDERDLTNTVPYKKWFRSSQGLSGLPGPHVSS